MISDDAHGIALAKLLTDLADAVMHSCKRHTDKSLAVRTAIKASIIPRLDQILERLKEHR